MKNWQFVRPEDLVPYELNAKIHNPEQVTKIARSIAEFGWTQPIVADKNLVVIIGHGRLMAALQLGEKQVPVIIRDDLTEEQTNALRLLDNKLNESDYDPELLRESLELVDLKDWDFDWGITLPEDEPVLADAEDDDYEIEVPETPVTQPGQIYQLGKHRLMCGDSTALADVETLVAGAQIDMLLTDPPYGIAYQGKTKDGLTIENDDLHGADFLDFLTKAFASASSVLKPGGAFYIWYADSGDMINRQAAAAVGWEIRQGLIWVKSQLILGRSDYQWQHEPCLYGWKDGAAHYFTDARTESTVISDIEQLKLNSLKRDELKDLVVKLMTELETTSTVIFEQKPTRNAEHPTMKPVRLMGRLVRNSSRPGETVLDLFGGSGSTLIACEQLNRKCCMMEVDPKYCDVIIDRWEKYTGAKAVLLNG